MVEPAIATKLVEKKQDLRTIRDSPVLMNSYSNGTADKVKDIDLSFNLIDSPNGLELFPNLKSLLLDHNAIPSIKDFPTLQSLQTLSLSFNKIENLELTLLSVAKKFPSLRHLNLMKNPINPMFGKDDKYEKFRCMFKVWMPSLQTLDGVDFSKNQSALRKYEKEIS